MMETDRRTLLEDTFLFELQIKDVDPTKKTPILILYVAAHAQQHTQAEQQTPKLPISTIDENVKKKKKTHITDIFKVQKKHAKKLND